ncbi:hypothetical protein [Streptomyces sp. NPDC054787]
MDRNVPSDRQGAGAADVVLDSTLFLPGRSTVPTGTVRGGGMNVTTAAERLALMPQFLEPLGLRIVDDVDENDESPYRER